MINILDEKELLFLKIMDKLAKAQPDKLKFKGAMVLKTILANKDYDKASRDTQDIDGDFYNENYDYKPLVKSFQNELNSLGVIIEVKREPTPSRSLGLEFLKDGKKISKMDLSFRLNKYTTTHTYNDIVFEGSIIEKIISDKVLATSGTKIFRRVKDIFDLFLIKEAFDSININDVWKIINEMDINEDKKIDDFDGFLNRKSDLAQAYSKFTGTKNAPDFDTLYNDVLEFIKPFINKKKDVTWSNKTKKWK